MIQAKAQIIAGFLNHGKAKITSGTTQKQHTLGTSCINQLGIESSIGW